MGKRYTDTEKYNDAWFVELESIEKLLFYYLIDNVDNAGFYEVSFRHLQFHLGFSKDEILGAIMGLGRGLLGADLNIKSGDKIYLKNFLKHQKMIPLNPFNSYHINALRSFESNLYFVEKHPILQNITIKGVKKQDGKIVKEYDTKLLKYLKEKKGLDSPIVKVKVKVKVKEEVNKGVLGGKKSATEIVELYHDLCIKLPRVKILSETRKTKIKTRLSDHGFENIKKVFEIASNSKFLNGKNTQGWKASFDWLINSSNFIKVLEGNYDNKENTEKKSFGSETEKYLAKYD